MLLSDLAVIFQWWSIFFVIGIIFIPITSLIFPNFLDKGYIFSKIIGIALISYVVFILGFLKILSFETHNIFLVSAILVLINIFIYKKSKSSFTLFKPILPFVIIEEFLFLAILIFWSMIHAHQPDIQGLEKYMDFGFVNSILRAKYFPPLDMWLTPFSINYYYFGHLVTAMLTKISYLPSYLTYNLMLSTIAALTFTAAFSIGANLIYKLKVESDPLRSEARKLKVIAGGLLTAVILNFAGNLHTIYLFFKPYENENPVPFWQLIFSPLTYPNNYWYPNATRFIENTIHEFPLYSYVVSDLHGHVLDIPFVLLTIAVLLSLIFNFQFSIFNQIKNFKNKNSFQISNFKFQIALLSFLLAVMYMTNAWDGFIYFLLTIIVIFFIQLRSSKNYILHTIYYILLLGLGFFIFTLPFNLNFKPFASGIGVLCAPQFLTEIGKFGPFLFETDHCQRSPWWQMIILYGFFYFWVVSFIIFLFKSYKLSNLDFIKNLKLKIENLPVSDIFILILITLSTLLIIIPEFIYVKDIYPAHYRANTMFKLVYQSFMMLSLSSGYIIIRIITNFKFQIGLLAYWIIGLFVVLVVFLYPYHAIKSYFGELKTYKGLNGTKYLSKLYSTDYEGILWVNKNIKGQPVILEAQGDSYTDYARVSTNTGLPTVLGWTVHEWLWRGSYDIPSPRILDVQKMYESENIEETKNLLKKYGVEYIFLGDLERQKYQKINEEKLQLLGKIIYRKENTKIIKLN